jgi:hypothetical protein
MDPWAQNPVWQNYSSLVREAKTADKAKTGMERSHHAAASLYFGIAALEAFVNAKMRDKMERSKVPEQEIVKKLRSGQIVEKLNRWPMEIVGKQLTLSKNVISVISAYNEIRGEVTHVKKHGQLLYRQLDSINPLTLSDSVGEYIVRFYEAEGTPYPYWIFGWNYLNPRTNSYEIILTHNDQFCFSLQALGLKVAVPPYCEPEFLRFERYLAIKQVLSSIPHCEPKWIFPFKPILCQQWWTSEHQISCGHVTDEAIESARNFGKSKRQVSES